MQTISNLIASVRHQTNNHPHWAIVLVTVWIALEYVVFGPYSYLAYYDNSSYVSSQLAVGHGGGDWFRYGMGGLDLLTMQYVVPIGRFLNIILPGFLAYQVQVLAGIGAPAIFTYLLLRHRLKLNPDASLIGSAAYALSISSPFSTHHLDYALLPAIIWLLGWVTSMSSARAVFGTIFFGFLYASSSLIVYAVPFIPIGVTIWFLFIEFRKDIQFWLLSGLFWICYVILKVPDIWSLVLNVRHSQRILDPTKNSPVGDVVSDTVMTFWSVVEHWDHQTMLVLFAIAMILIVRPRHKLLNKTLKVLPGLAVFMLISVFILRVTPFFIERGLSTFSFVRIQWVLVFYVVVVSAVAVNYWPEQGRGRLPTFKPGVLAVLVVMLFGYSISAKLGIVGSWVFRGGYAAVYTKPAMQDLADQISNEDEPFRAGGKFGPIGSIQSDSTANFILL